MSTIDWERVLQMEPMAGDEYKMSIQRAIEIRERMKEFPALAGQPEQLLKCLEEELALLEAQIAFYERWKELFPSERLVASLQLRMRGIRAISENIRSALV